MNSTLVSGEPKSAGAFALAVINGPGIFVASCLVVLGVTRALVKMATPLGAPLSVPGARLALAAVAYKAAPAVWGKLGAASAGAPGAEAVAEHNSRYEGTPYRRAVAASEAWDGPGVRDGMNLAVAGGGARSELDVLGGARTQGSSAGSGASAASASSDVDVVDGTAHEIGPERQPASAPPTLPAGVPDFAAARARIAEQGGVSPAQVSTALGQLDDGELAHVRDAAQSARALQQAAGGDEGDVYFRERMAAGIADGTAFRHDNHSHAAVIGASSHQVVLDALDPPADPGKHPAHDQSMYTERELRRDWTQPGDDGARR